MTCFIGGGVEFTDFGEEFLVVMAEVMRHFGYDVGHYSFGVVKGAVLVRRGGDISAEVEGGSSSDDSSGG